MGRGWAEATDFPGEIALVPSPVPTPVPTIRRVGTAGLERFVVTVIGIRIAVLHGWVDRSRLRGAQVVPMARRFALALANPSEPAHDGADPLLRELVPARLVELERLAQQVGRGRLV